MDVAAAVLSVLGSVTNHPIELSYGPEASGGDPIHSPLDASVVDFCRDVFSSRGAVLAGPHGGRWVYELRRELDLFCKVSPLVPSRELRHPPGPIRPRELAGADILVVREQSGGVYQGRWSEGSRAGGEIAEHAFSNTRREVSRVVEAAAAMAASRRGKLAVVVKRGGVPSMSALWERCAEHTAKAERIDCEVLDLDFAAYRLIRDPHSFDVVATSNLFGDVLADVGAVLLGSRGLAYGASFDSTSAAVYQTNHGAAHDLAGRDVANPVGQILAVAMMLRESFGLARESRLIEDAVASTWRTGWRTEDVAEPGCRVVGTREMGARVEEAVAALAGGRVAMSGTDAA